MVKRTQEPAPPTPRDTTIRQAIMDFLGAHGPASARDISMAVGVPEKSVGAHLEHLQKTLKARQLKLQVIPAECLDCGFIFQKRDRLSRPGKCPACRSTHLSEPLYRVA